jgi:hypothetical protein
MMSERARPDNQNARVVKGSQRENRRHRALFPPASLCIGIDCRYFIQYDATLAAHETAKAIAAGLRLKW